MLHVNVPVVVVWCTEWDCGMKKDKTSVGWREVRVKGAEMQNDSRISNTWEMQRSAKKRHMHLLLAPPSENALWSTKTPLKVVQKQCSADTSLWKNMGMPSFHCKIQKHSVKIFSPRETLKSLFDGFADVAVSGSHTRHQDLLSSFLFIFSRFLLLDLEHHLKEVSDVSQELDPAWKTVS